MMPRPSSIPNCLWITRRKRGLSRKKLAALLGHKPTAQLCRWEQGTQLPTLAHALLLAHLLQMPVEILFQGVRDGLIRGVERRPDDTKGEADGGVIEA